MRVESGEYRIIENRLPKVFAAAALWEAGQQVEQKIPQKLLCEMFDIADVSLKTVVKL